MSHTTSMFREAAESADIVRRQIAANAIDVLRLGATLRAMNPRAVVTCARGSSDHAATYAKYLIEAHTKTVTSSGAPSLSSVYDATPDLRGVLFIAISQSGKSPDLLAAVAHAKRCGAFVLALCNSPHSPLASSADALVQLHAGPETSVAATKSFIGSLSAIVHVLAAWTQDRALSSALLSAPELLSQAWKCDWSGAVEPLLKAVSLYVIGRGFGLGVAQEAALKFKETCALHAEAFSSAEVKHGPMTLVNAGFPVLMLSQNDETRAGMETLAREFISRKARVLLAGLECPGAPTLPTIRAHAVIEPMLLIQSFYRLVNALALARGLNPDRPPHLHKITETV
jgi:glucosamine--fructose-6-phosphate aminotransferase (isomerizing)